MLKKFTTNFFISLFLRLCFLLYLPATVCSFFLSNLSSKSPLFILNSLNFMSLIFFAWLSFHSSCIHCCSGLHLVPSCVFYIFNLLFNFLCFVSIIVCLPLLFLSFFSYCCFTFITVSLHLLYCSCFCIILLNISDSLLFFLPSSGLSMNILHVGDKLSVQRGFFKNSVGDFRFCS